MPKNGISPEWVRTCAQACSYETPYICNNEISPLPKNNLEKIFNAIQKAKPVANCELACNGSELVTEYVTSKLNGEYTKKSAVLTGFWLSSALDAANLPCPQNAPIPVPIPIHKAETQPVTVKRSNCFSEYFPKTPTFVWPSFSLPRLSNHEKTLTSIRSGNFVAATGGMLVLSLMIGLLILV